MKSEQNYRLLICSLFESGFWLILLALTTEELRHVGFAIVWFDFRYVLERACSFELISSRTPLYVYRFLNEHTFEIKYKFFGFDLVMLRGFKIPVILDWGTYVIGLSPAITNSPWKGFSFEVVCKLLVFDIIQFKY